jgi:myo-inositol-1(or 4)-monophosphatase
MNTEQLLETARKAALQAGQAMRERVGGDLAVNEAHQHDIKIQLDVDLQKMIENHLLGAFPDHAILGEEGGEGSDGKGYEWIVDPIDGTVNLFYGIPHFCTSIACRVDGETVCGVIYDPMRDECFWAAKGSGAFCNGKPIRASPRVKLEESILSVGFSKGPDAVGKALEVYHYYVTKVRKMRAMGSAALDMAYIASGRYDGYIEQGIKIWDIAAGQLILEEAGGKVDLTPKPGAKHHYHICAWNGCLDLPVR